MEQIKPNNLNPDKIEVIAQPNKPKIDSKNFRDEWRKSILENNEFLEKIRDTLEYKNLKNDYSDKDLRAIADTINEGGLNHIINLLNYAIRQKTMPEIREKAFELAKLLRDLGNLGYYPAASPIEGLVHLTTTLALKNLDSAIEVTFDDSRSDEYSRLFIFGNARDGSPENKEKAVNALKQYIDRRISELKFDKIDIKIMEWIITYEDKSAKARYLEALNDYFEKNPRDFSLIVACILGASYFFDIGVGQIVKILYKFELRELIKILIGKWLHGGGTKDHMPLAFEMNIDTIETLEKERPGIIKFLIEKFGIYNFGRYPESLLIKQYDEYENQELPYGVAIFAEDDHNASSFEDKEALESLGQNLENRYLIRLVEAAGKKDLLRLLTRLRLKYGADHKIAFGIASAHGNEEEITLGNPENSDRSLEIRDMFKYEGRKYELFEKDATIVLLSCNSGKDRGIGANISKVLDSTVIAPRSSSGIEKIEPIFTEDGKLKFEVKYSHRVRAKTFKPK